VEELLRDLPARRGFLKTLPEGFCFGSLQVDFSLSCRFEALRLLRKAGP
jgi:hypothetical protein